MLYCSIPAEEKRLAGMFAKVKEMAYTKYPLLSKITSARQGSNMSGNTFRSNVMYYTNKESVLYGIYGDFDFASTISDSNVIYHAGLPLLIPNLNVPADRQWTTWRNRGLDQKSTVADPLFTDMTNGDFTLLPNSPALQIGFKDIPFKEIGPYRDLMRASWPIGISD